MSGTRSEAIYFDLLEQEVRLARSVAISAQRAKPFSVWEVLIPIIFILGFMRNRQQRELFVQNFIFTKKLALEAARDISSGALPLAKASKRLETKTCQLLKNLDANIYSVAIQQAQLNEMRILMKHYRRLFDGSGRQYGDRIRAAYPDRQRYLVFLEELHQAENGVAAAAIATLGDQADRDMMARIETSAHRLRHKDADRFYHKMA